MFVRKGGKKILDSANQKEITFENDSNFDEWYTKNQSSDLNFGFSNLTKESNSITEAKSSLNHILEFLKDELSNLESNTLDPRRIDGGYKELEKKLKLSRT